MLKAVRINAEIQERADEHIAADAAEDVEVKHFHKFQIPNSKLQANSKFQIPKRSVVTSALGAWFLDFLWNLELGIWSFIRPSTH